MKKRISPFPQANNMELLFCLIYDIGQEGITKYEVSKKYSIELRQGSYYLDALCYLGLVDKIQTKYFLNAKSIDVRLSNPEKAKEKFISIITNHDFLKGPFLYYLENGKEKAICYLAGLIHSQYKLEMSTSNRRANSIISWFESIKNGTN